MKPIELQQPATFDDAVARALQSDGDSEPAVHGLIARVVESLNLRGDLLIDVGCGRGKLWPRLRARFAKCIGVDAVRYPGLPPDIELCETQLDSCAIALPGEVADAVVCSETIEHVENPRALMRELSRLAKPGAWLIVTTPNQLSLASLMTLPVKHRFSYFQDVHYPAHLTALLEVDLMRIAGGMRSRRRPNRIHRQRSSALDRQALPEIREPRFSASAVRQRAARCQKASTVTSSK